MIPGVAQDPGGIWYPKGIVMVENDGECRRGTILVSPGQPVQVKFAGDFDVANQDEVMDALATIPAGDVLIDLEQVTFGSSAFLGCLLRLQQRTSAQGHQVEMSALSDVMRRLLTLTCTAHLFPHRDRSDVMEPRTAQAQGRTTRF